MSHRAIRFYVVSCCIILFITSVAKVVGSLGYERILYLPDPIFLISSKHLLISAGVLEFVVAIFCLYSKHDYRSVGIIVWLATCFLAYRLCLLWVAYTRPCRCFGYLTDNLHISPKTADIGIRIVLAYLLIGSYASLFWLWRHREKSKNRRMN
jgi:hypothetical protein